MEDLVVGNLTISAADLEERFDTSGGPGGQHANRSETAVTLRLKVRDSSLPDEVREKLTARLGDVIEVTAAEERSQHRNRERARERLAETIESALTEPKPRRRTKPTRASRQRRLDTKRARSETKRQRRKPTPED